MTTTPFTTARGADAGVGTTPYYADGKHVRMRGKVTNNPDGTQSLGMDWPVANVGEYSDPGNAVILAGLMNKGEQHEGLVAALSDAEKSLAQVIDDFENALVSSGVMCSAAVEQNAGPRATLDNIRAALATAQELTHG